LVDLPKKKATKQQLGGITPQSSILTQNHVIQVQLLWQKSCLFARLEAAHSQQKELQRRMGG
jgi:hypothetical protein